MNKDYENFSTLGNYDKQFGLCIYADKDSEVGTEFVHIKFYLSSYNELFVISTYNQNGVTEDWKEEINIGKFTQNLDEFFDYKPTTYSQYRSEFFNLLFNKISIMINDIYDSEYFEVSTDDLEKMLDNEPKIKTYLEDYCKEDYDNYMSSINNEELIECIVKEDIDDTDYSVEQHPIYGNLYSFKSKRGLYNYLEDFENGKIN